MKKIMFLTLGVAASLLGRPASAGPIDVDAVLSWTPNGSNFDYTIKLDNLATSTDSISTFWYAWIPGQDYLTTKPISVSSPTGWTSLITHFPNLPTNGFAIQYKTPPIFAAP
jgi:hypothetical protein